jgi:uncharacterized iron-regulated protein
MRGLFVVFAGVWAAVAQQPAALPSAPQEVTPLPAWQAPLGRDHPLAGRVWEVGGERFVTPAMLAAELAGARYLLLGEKHDNPDHHRLQAWVLRELQARGRAPLVAFEMLHAGQAEALARHLAQRPGQLAGLAEAVGWPSSGWPEWSLYEPIFAVAVAARWPLATANLPPAEIRRIAAEGLAALGAERAATLGLDRPLGEAAEASLAAEIEASHCGHATPALIAGMSAAQRVRDAVMADAVLSAGAEGAVLITGTGHARRDRGVPWYLAARGVAEGVVTVALVEVQEGVEDPRGVAGSFEGSLPFDYLWFTPRVDDEDPCEKFREQLRKLSARSSATPAP